MKGGILMFMMASVRVSSLIGKKRNITATSQCYLKYSVTYQIKE